MSAAIGGVGVSQAQQTPDANAFAELDSGEFIKILIAELSNQDPFAPNDSAQILDQISSLSSIESQAKLEKSIASLVLQNGIAQASGMIGRSVQGLTEGGNRIDGIVTSIRVVDGEARLELDSGVSLPMGRVELISEADADG